MAQNGTPLGSMVINLSMDGTQFSDSLQGIRKQIKLAESAMQTNMRILGDAGSEYQRYGRQIEGLNNIIQAQGHEMEILRRNHQRAIDQYGEGSTQATNYGIQINRLAGRISGYQRQLRNAEDALQRLGNEENTATTKGEKFRRNLSRISDQMDEISERASGMGDRLQAALSVGGAAAGAAVGSMAIEVDNNMTKVENALDMTKAQSEETKASVKKVWSEGFGEDLNDVSNAVIQVKQNMKGLAGEDVENATKNALLLGQTFEADVNEVTRAGNSLMKNFGMSSEESFDMIAKGARNGMNFSNEMFDNMAEYTTSFKEAGFSAEEMFSILTNGADQGYNLDRLNDTMLEFKLQSEDSGKSYKEAMDQMSPATQKVFKQFEAGKASSADLYKAVIPNLKKMKAEMSAKDFNTVGKGLFGTKWEDQGAEVVMAMGTANDAYKNTAGEMKKVRKNAEQSFGQKWKQTMRSAKEAIMPLAESFVDVANIVLPPLVSAMKHLAAWFDKLPKSIKVTAVVLGALALAAGPAILILGRIVMSVMAAGRAFLKVASWASRLSKIFTLIRTAGMALLGPVGLIIAAIALLVGGFITAYRNSDKFRNAINKIGGVIAGVIKWLKKFASGIKELWKGNQNGGSKILKSLGLSSETIGKINSAVKTVKAVFRNMMAGIKLVFKGIWTTVKGIWNTLTGFMTGDTKKLSSGLKGIFKGLASVLKGIFKVSIFGTLSTIFKSMIDKLKSLATDGIKKIVQMFKDMPKTISKGFNSAVNGVKGAAKKVGGAVVSGIGWGVNKAIGGVNWVLDKLGSSKTVKEFSIPKYAKGTGAHPGGLAWVGDGGQEELIRTPDGRTMLSPNTDTLVNLPRGSEVVSGPKTRQILNVPRYKSGSGGLLDSAWDMTKKAGSAVKDTAVATKDAVVNTTSAAFNKVKDWSSEIWDWVSSPDKIKDLLMNVIGNTIPASMQGGIMPDMFNSMMKTVVDTAKGWLFDEAESQGGGAGGNFGDYSPFSGNFNSISNKMGVYDFLYDLGKQIVAKFKGQYPSLYISDGKRSAGTKTKSGSVSDHSNGLGLDLARGGIKDMSYLKMAKSLVGHPYLKYTVGSDKWNKNNDGNFANFPWGGHMNHLHLSAKNPSDAKKSGASNGPSGAGAEAWRAQIKKAAKQMKVTLTHSELNGIIAQIHRESTGNQNIIQSSAVRDVNTRNGNPAKGLLQYIPSTFNAYKVKGHGNIFSGYDQLLAFFNNSSWRRNLPYGRSGWGPTGSRRFENGGLITSRIDNATIGEKGSEIIIPLSSAKRTRGLQLLSQAANRMGVSLQSDKPQAQKNVVSSSDELLREQNNLLKQQINLLTSILMKDNSVYLDGKELHDSNNRYAARATKKTNIARGLV